MAFLKGSQPRAKLITQNTLLSLRRLMLTLLILLLTLRNLLNFLPLRISSNPSLSPLLNVTLFHLKLWPCLSGDQ